jgi:hypothetical protein
VTLQGHAGLSKWARAFATRGVDRNVVTVSHEYELSKSNFRTERSPLLENNLSATIFCRRPKPSDL